MDTGKPILVSGRGEKEWKPRIFLEQQDGKFVCVSKADEENYHAGKPYCVAYWENAWLPEYEEVVLVSDDGIVWEERRFHHIFKEQIITTQGSTSLCAWEYVKPLTKEYTTKELVQRIEALETKVAILSELMELVVQAGIDLENTVKEK
jgi:hypothetical protein